MDSGEGVLITVNSFRGRGVVTMVGKRAGMEGTLLLEEGGEKVLEEEEEEDAGKDGLWSTLSRWRAILVRS